MNMVKVIPKRIKEKTVKQLPWNIGELFKTPKTYPAPGFSETGVKALYYEGLPWQGKPTRVFAWYGVPKQKAENKLPAMILVHGGGGTAFPEWVRLWTSRGYAALAMDTCGCTPGGEHDKRPRHPFGGPPGWGGFDQIDQPLVDQWPCHAVADVILGHSLLRSQPQVDPDRIGITGISWGGYLTCITAGLDDRFKFAAPVYGCGFLGENSGWCPMFKQMGLEKADKWLKMWDPSVYLKNARLPMLWVNGTNDDWYHLDSLWKTYHLPKGKNTLCIRIRMPHGHGGPGENPEEIHAFANTFLKNGVPLAGVTPITRKKDQVQASFSSQTPIAKAELVLTKSKGPWVDRLWESFPANLDPAGKTVSAPLPKGVTACYFNLTDARNLIVSTEHIEVKE
jgi:dienelactone hydrolase